MYNGNIRENTYAYIGVIMMEYLMGYIIRVIMGIKLGYSQLNVEPIVMVDHGNIMRAEQGRTCSFCHIPSGNLT